MTVVMTTREIARPILDTLKQAFLLDDRQLSTELRSTSTRSSATEIVIAYACSILSHGEILRLAEIAKSVHGKLAVIPDDKSQMKVELSLPSPSNR